MESPLYTVGCLFLFASGSCLSMACWQILTDLFLKYNILKIKHPPQISYLLLSKISDIYIIGAQKTDGTIGKVLED